MTRLAVEIARTLPALAEASEEHLCDLIGGWTSDLPPLSRGEGIVVRWARVTEELVAGCDAETVDRALETVDRFRASMRQPATKVVDLMAALEASFAAAKAQRKTAD